MFKFKRTLYLIIICMAVIVNSGCSLLSTVLSAGAAYGIYQATK